MNATLQRYFLSILGKKDYSVGELVFKGVNKDYTTQEVQEVVNWLIERKFVSDLRLAENLIQSYQSKKGKIWILQKLQARKVDQEIIQKAISQNLSENIQPSDSVKEKLERKYKILDWNQIDQATKQKVVGFLSRQGFTNCWQIIQTWSSS
ncbi:MAG: regulatory protein RecX [bacterium]